MGWRVWGMVPVLSSILGDSAMFTFSRCTGLGVPVIWLVAFGFGLGISPIVADELETIDEREQEYEQAQKDARDAVLKAYAAELLKASKDNRSDDVARLTNHLKVFRSSGIMVSEELHPQFIESAIKTHAARNRLMKAYEEAKKKCVEELRFEKAEELRAIVKTRGLDSRLVSIRLAKRHTDFICHGDYLGVLAPTKTKSQKMNATFEMVAGLADGKGVSFRSVNVPNHYLVHGGNRIRLQDFQDKEGFRLNGTFLLHQGQGRKSAVMFVAINFPTHAIWAKGQELWIEPVQPERHFLRPCGV